MNTSVYTAEPMRTWAEDGFMVELFETSAMQDTHTMVAYRLYDLTWSGRADMSPIFEGFDYGVPSQQAIDGDDAVRRLLSFLSTRPGDTDSEYFANYTPRQVAWVEERAEELSLWTD